MDALERFGFTNVPVDVNKVSVLIDEDVPQAHAALGYCWGDNPINQPYAVKIPFEWCVAGPTNKEKDDSKPIALCVFKFDLTDDKTIGSTSTSKKVLGL